MKPELSEEQLAELEWRLKQTYDSFSLFEELREHAPALISLSREALELRVRLGVNYENSGELVKDRDRLAAEVKRLEEVKSLANQDRVRVQNENRRLRDALDLCRQFLESNTGALRNGAGDSPEQIIQVIRSANDKPGG